jgi:hypothetical protein
MFLRRAPSAMRMPIRGIGLFWTEDAQQAGAGVRVAEVAGGASHRGEVFW